MKLLFHSDQALQAETEATHPSLPVDAKNLRIETLEYDENDHLQITASEYLPAAYV